MVEFQTRSSTPNLKVVFKFFRSCGRKESNRKMEAQNRCPYFKKRNTVVLFFSFVWILRYCINEKIVPNPKTVDSYGKQDRTVTMKASLGWVGTVNNNLPYRRITSLTSPSGDKTQTKGKIVGTESYCSECRDYILT